MVARSRAWEITTLGLCWVKRITDRGIFVNWKIHSWNRFRDPPSFWSSPPSSSSARWCTRASSAHTWVMLLLLLLLLFDCMSPMLIGWMGFAILNVSCLFGTLRLSETETDRGIARWVNFPCITSCFIEQN